MRKILGLSVFALMAFLPSLAAPVSLQQARNKAQAFFRARTVGNKPGARLVMQVSAVVQELSVTTDTTHSPYFIFNNGDNRGFVVIAGDNSAPDILAYSDHGQLSLADMPPALQALLDGYAAEMKMIATGAINAAPTASKAARQVVAPLLTTQWGQAELFYEECFTAKGKQAMAGEAAAAMAQVMNYYRYPKVMENPVPAYTTAKGDSYEELAPTVFDWELMLDSYQGEATDEQIAAVAHIVSYAAHAAKTDFGTSYSSAEIADCAAAFNECFSYANEVKVVTRDECGVEEWDRLVYHELAHGRPVIYFAANGENETHTFVCDGYDGEGLYHINWGQEGNYDGYYRLHAIHPAALVSSSEVSSFGYSMRHKALVGISPIEVHDNYGVHTGDVPEATWQDLEVTAVQQRLDNNIKKMLRVTLDNHGTSDFAGPLHLQIDDSFISTENLYLEAGGTGYVDFYFVKEPETYAIKVVDGASSQVLFEDDAFEVVNTDVAPPTIVDYKAFTTDMVTMTQNGTVFEMETTLHNDGYAVYFGRVDVKLYNIQSENGSFVFAITTTKSSDVVIPPGGTCKVISKIDDLEVGDRFYYAIKLAGKTIKEGGVNRLYTVVDGYAYWDGEGTHRTAPLAETILVPEAAVAVDFSGCDLSEVMVSPNANPNTLYYIDGDTDVPAPLFDSNVVMGDGAVGDIAFHDGYGFFVPRSFNVEGDVAYERTVNKGSFTEDGWQTIVLPFGVEKVTADGRTIDWQHGFNGNNYDFWLRGLDKVSADTAYFEAVEQWRPNVPYLFAVPDGRWLESFDLTCKTLKFSATNTRVEKTVSCAVVTPVATLTGTIGVVTADEAFVMNEEGDAFARMEEVTAVPFRCWLSERSKGALSDDVIHIASHSSLLGDVNNDGIVSVVDVMQVVNIITGHALPILPMLWGDVTKDGIVSVADVMALVDLIMR